jgi:hypothetical protein
MKLTLALAATLGLGLLASPASADEPAKVTTLPTTTIHGRPQKPGITIVLERARMQLGATTPTLASVLASHTATSTELRRP